MKDSHNIIESQGDAHSLIESRSDAHSLIESQGDAHSLIESQGDAHSLIESRSDAHSLIESRSDAHSPYWSTTISPRDQKFRLGLREVWQKRFLLWLFVKRDITVQFKQTIFGMGWYFISPLFSTLIYIVVFGRIANIPTDDIPQPVFYLSGICLWEYFSTCLTAVSTTFQTNANLYGKVYFPRLVTPVSVCLGKLFRFGIQLATFVIVYLFFVLRGVHLVPNLYLLLFPVILFCLMGIALGLGLIVSSMTTKYRDLVNFFGTFVSLWMYATPIVYPLSYVTNPTLHQFMVLNPLTALVETFKYGAFGAGSFSWTSLAYSVGCTLVLLVIGIMMFNRKQKFFIDTI